MNHERRDSSNNFDWKDCLRKQANAKERLTHQFSIRDSYVTGSIANRLRNSSLGQIARRDSLRVAGADTGRREKRGKSNLENETSEERISEGTFNSKKADKNSLKEGGFFKVSKKCQGQKSFRESYMKVTESFVQRQRPSLRNADSSTIDQPPKPKSESITRKTHELAEEEKDEANKENNGAVVNREIQDIKKCLEAMKTTHNNLKEKNKPTRKVSQNPVLRLKQQNELTDLNQPRISASHTEPDLMSQESSMQLRKTEPCDEASESFLAYAAVSDVGTTRKYNEDRVCVIEKIVRSSEISTSSFFGIYDGHGGAGCADFLRDNLFNLIVKNPNFKNNIPVAFKEGIEAAENRFLLKSKRDEDWSGSCLVVVVIKENKIVIGNVGDSRALLITKNTEIQLSEDHKPEFESERWRIIKAGGKVYRNKIENMIETMDFKGNTQISKKDVQLGPFRVEPGGLSVSRAIGDIKAKDKHYGGNHNCLISNANIKEICHNHLDEFIVLACDGIFDVLSNHDIAQISRGSLRTSHYRAFTIVQACEKASKDIIEAAKQKGSKDNLTVILVLFKHLYYFA